MTKKEARKYYRKKREELTEEQYGQFNHRILKTFSGFDFSRIAVVHTYLTIKEKKEPVTEPIIDWLRINYPRITICVPKTDMEGGHMDNVIYDTTVRFEISEFGIPEPVDGEHLDAGQIDLAIIPMLGFDQEGNRVGYGKGFYDRFLKYCRQDIIKTGLCFFEPIGFIEDTTQFDVPLSRCITPFNLYVF